MGVTVVLERPDGSVPPGSESVSDIRIRNTGAVVDQFELDVVGDAASWAHVEPPLVNLMPGEEGSARLVFAPPRSSRVVAGPVPFALRVMSREDTAGSSIEESVVMVGPFSQVAADLVPRTSYGRFTGRHQLALDNLGNHPELISVVATDPDRLLKLKVEPPSTTVEPGTATFVKVRAKPKKTFWLGPSKTIPFQVVITGEDAGQSITQGSMLQQAILPAWFFKALAFIIAVAIALVALWFAFLKPAVESTAQAVVDDRTGDLVAAVEEGNEIAQQANEQSQQAAEDAAAAKEVTKASKQTVKRVEKLETQVETGGTGTVTLDLTKATDFRITTGAAPGAGVVDFSHDVPDGKIIWVSDIVLQNPNGDTGTLKIRRGSDTLFDFGLANFRDLDYHLIQPIAFTSAQDVIVRVVCKNTDGICTPSVYFTGRMTDESPTSTP